MTTELRLLLAVLAVYRLAQLIAYDDGPFAIFYRLRSWTMTIGAGAKIGTLTWTIRELIKCPYCLGIWFAIIAVILLIFPTIVGDWLLVALAIAGGQCFLQDLSTRANKE